MRPQRRRRRTVRRPPRRLRLGRIVDCPSFLQVREDPAHLWGPRPIGLGLPPSITARKGCGTYLPSALGSRYDSGPMDRRRELLRRGARAARSGTRLRIEGHRGGRPAGYQRGAERGQAVAPARPRARRPLRPRGRDARWLQHDLARPRTTGRWPAGQPRGRPAPRRGDRKSTRLNSSHMSISYAVFCLKKKKSIKSTTYVKNKIKESSRW